MAALLALLFAFLAIASAQDGPLFVSTYTDDGACGETTEGNTTAVEVTYFATNDTCLETSVSATLACGPNDCLTAETLAADILTSDFIGYKQYPEGNACEAGNETYALYALADACVNDVSDTSFTMSCDETTGVLTVTYFQDLDCATASGETLVVEPTCNETTTIISTCATPAPTEAPTAPTEAPTEAPTDEQTTGAPTDAPTDSNPPKNIDELTIECQQADTREAWSGSLSTATGSTVTVKSCSKVDPTTFKMNLKVDPKPADATAAAALCSAATTDIAFEFGTTSAQVTCVWVPGSSNGYVTISGLSSFAASSVASLVMMFVAVLAVLF